MNTNKKIIVGLGNPGKSYEKTPHNAGQSAVLYTAGQYGVGKWSFDKKSQYWRANIISEDGNILFVIPAGYMNRSGETLKKLFSEEEVSQELDVANLVVVHDDIDLPLGEFRISFDGSSGGHNGIKDIIEEIGTKDFVRMRLGVAPSQRGGEIDKPEGQEVADFLLSPMNFFDRRKLKKTLPEVKEAISLILRRGHKEAMDKFN